VRATGDRITAGRQTLLETEELGVSILQDLHRQRETIVGARDSLHDADDSVGRARKVLTTMSRRAVQNKLILVRLIAKCSPPCPAAPSRTSSFWYNTQLQYVASYVV
jgi:hypothetical protein